MVKLERILVVRNDGIAEWKISEYILEKGEYGIAWLPMSDNTKKPIVKIGDGKRLWINLPQAEPVFLESARISHPFGKYQIVNGSVDADWKGKTVTEWIKEALIVPEELSIIEPSITLNLISFETDCGDYEIGGIINKVNWEVLLNPGLYPYGSHHAEEQFLPDSKLAYSVACGEEVWWGSLDEGIPNGTNIVNFVIDTTEEKKYADLQATLTWSEARNIPLNNLKEPVETKKLYDGTQEVHAQIVATGYREGCFCGGIVGDITAEKIRALDRTKKNYKPQALEFVIPKDSDSLVLAIHSEQPPLSIYNITAGAELLQNCVISEIDIPGQNNYAPTAYKLYTYTPAKPFKLDARVRVILG